MHTHWAIPTLSYSRTLEGGRLCAHRRHSTALTKIGDVGLGDDHDVHGVVRDLGLAALVADAAVNPHAVEARVVDRVELVDGGRGRGRS